MQFKNVQLVVVLSLAALALPWSIAQAEVKRSTMGEDIIKVLVSDDEWQPDEFKQGIAVPVVYAMNSDVVLDGNGDDAAWSMAEEISVPLSYGSTDSVRVKALYTDTDILLRVQWRDATENREHHPWVWNEAAGQYEVGTQVEDSLLLSFEAGCEWFPSFLSGYEFDFDAWHWMAARTDPMGQALDLAGSMKGKDLGTTTRYDSRNTEDEWNLKFDDWSEGILYKNWDQLDRKYEIWPVIGEVHHHRWLDGSRTESEFLRLLAPPETPPSSRASVAPRFEILQLKENANDVLAKGKWEDGIWTVELRRKLFTEAGMAWDVQFERLTQFSMHVFDGAERLDESSESPRLFLKFLQKSELLTSK